MDMINGGLLTLEDIEELRRHMIQIKINLYNELNELKDDINKTDRLIELLKKTSELTFKENNKE